MFLSEAQFRPLTFQKVLSNQQFFFFFCSFDLSSSPRFGSSALTRGKNPHSLIISTLESTSAPRWALWIWTRLEECFFRPAKKRERHYRGRVAKVGQTEKWKVKLQSFESLGNRLQLKVVVGSGFSWKFLFLLPPFSTVYGVQGKESFPSSFNELERFLFFFLRRSKCATRMNFWNDFIRIVYQLITWLVFLFERNYSFFLHFETLWSTPPTKELIKFENLEMTA